MRVAVMTAPGEVHVEDRPDPVIVEPTDAIIRVHTAHRFLCTGSNAWRKLEQAEHVGRPLHGACRRIHAPEADVRNFFSERQPAR